MFSTASIYSITGSHPLHSQFLESSLRHTKCCWNSLDVLCSELQTVPLFVWPRFCISERLEAKLPGNVGTIFGLFWSSSLAWGWNRNSTGPPMQSSSLSKVLGVGCTSAPKWESIWPMFECCPVLTAMASMCFSSLMFRIKRTFRSFTLQTKDIKGHQRTTMDQNGALDKASTDAFCQVEAYPSKHNSWILQWLKMTEELMFTVYVLFYSHEDSHMPFLGSGWFGSYIWGKRLYEQPIDSVSMSSSCCIPHGFGSWKHNCWETWCS